MTFPQTPRIELNLDSVWTDITTDVYQRDPIEITRGRTDEASAATPSRMTLTLNNRDGKYSPRNPMGEYFGLIGRNTPIRLTLRQAPLFDAVSSPTPGTGTLTWTHTPVGDPTGVVIWIMQSGGTSSQLTALTYGGVTVSTGTGVTTVGGRYYRGVMTGDIPTGPQTVEATFSGATARAAGCISVVGGDETEVNNVPLVQSGTTANPSVSPGTSEETLVLGLCHSGVDAVGDIAPGAAYTQAVEHDFGTDVGSIIYRSSAAPAGTPELNWVAAANDWTINDVALTAVSYRYFGEVASFPPQWDTSGNDAYVSIEAAGILRRLGQGDQPVQNGLKAYIATTDAHDYWPLDDGAASTSGANQGDAANGNGAFFRWPSSGGDAPTWAFGVGDLGLTLPAGLQVTTTGPYGYVRGDVAMLTPSTTKAIEFVYKATTLGEVIMQSREYNNLHWNVQLRGDSTNDDFVLFITDETSGSPAVVPIADSSAHEAITDGREHHVRLQLTANGGSTDYVLYVDGVSTLSGTTAVASISGTAWVHFNYDPAAADTPLALGHVAVWKDAAVPSIAATSVAAFGWLGEAAGRRVERLCDEEGVPFVSSGDLDDTLAMGPLFGDYFFNQLAEIENTDLGMLYEPRSSLALGYRTRSSLYNQDARLTLDFSEGQLAPPFEPVEDDRNTRNDVFAQRREGGSYQATLTTGPLSVNEPPAGVGRYKSEFPVNVETDEMLPEVAGWLLTLGTVDEPRFPQLTIQLAHPSFTGSPAQTLAALACDVGDRLAVTDAEAANLHDDLSQLIVGSKERIGRFEHEISFSCAPGSPYLVDELDDPDTRVDPGEASTLNEALTTTETDMDVASTAGTLWTTDGGQMPISIMVGGEEMSVTAISGAASPQTFTVTRSVNGVVKTHSTGAVVRLKRPGVIAL